MTHYTPCLVAGCDDEFSFEIDWQGRDYDGALLYALQIAAACGRGHPLTEEVEQLLDKETATGDYDIDEGD